MYYGFAIVSAHKIPRIVAAVCHTSDTQEAAIVGKHAHKVVFLEIAIYGNYTHRQYADSLATAHTLDGTAVENNLALDETATMGYPFFYARNGAFSWQETSA